MLTNDIVSFEQPGPGGECYEQTVFSIPISAALWSNLSRSVLFACNKIKHFLIEQCAEGEWVLKGGVGGGGILPNHSCNFWTSDVSPKKNLQIYKWGERMSNNKTKTYNAMYHNFFANGYVGKLTRTILSFTLYDGYKPLFPFRWFLPLE